MDAREKSKGKWLRIAWVVAGIVVLAGGGLVALNLSAAKANGADAPQEQGEEAGADQGAEASESDEGTPADDGEGEADEDEKAPIPVEVATVESRPVSAYIRSSANLVAENQVKVLSEVEGRVAKLNVEEGDYVRQGQVLASLVHDDAEIGLKKAELRQSNARAAFERGKDLIAKELISREEFDNFKMEHDLAGEELAEARWTLEKTVIRSPFSGLVSERMLQVGQHIRPGDELFQVTDVEPLIARIFLPERDVLGLELGREVLIVLNADESVRFGGRVRQISPIVDVATGTIKVTVEADDPPAGVRPGSFVGVHIVRETHPEALVVPREAVLRELQKAHVFVTDGETASKREVTLGLEEDEVIEALSGLAPGERVIVAGQGGLKDGSLITVLGAEPAAETAQAAATTAG